MFLKQNVLKFIGVFTLFVFAQSVYALEPIDTQIGPNGMTVHLIKAKVGNGVLTASLLYENDTGSSFLMKRPELSEIHYVAGSKKYPILKDANGDWLASPVHSDKLFRKDVNDDFRFKKGSKEVIWFKFPAPPEGTTSIEISIPGVSPFTAGLK